MDIMKSEINENGKQNTERAICEWNEAQAFVLNELDKILARLGRSKEMRSYVFEMKGYPRVLYVCAAWVEEDQKRFTLGTAFGIHCCGLKLIDDLIDCDQTLKSYDLVAGHVFCESASDRFASVYPGRRLTGDWLNSWLPIYEYVFQEPNIEVTEYESWLKGAIQKSGKLMAEYCRASFSGDYDRSIVSAAVDAMEAVGVLYMISDDIRDHYEYGESKSNLAALIKAGRIPHADVIETMMDIKERIIKAYQKKTPAFDFWAHIEPVFSNTINKINTLNVELS